MAKRKYEKPEIEILTLDEADIIKTSNEVNFSGAKVQGAAANWLEAWFREGTY